MKFGLHVLSVSSASSEAKINCCVTKAATELFFGTNIFKKLEILGFFPKDLSKKSDVGTGADHEVVYRVEMTTYLEKKYLENRKKNCFNALL